MDGRTNVRTDQQSAVLSPVNKTEKQKRNQREQPIKSEGGHLKTEEREGREEEEERGLGNDRKIGRRGPLAFECPGNGLV